MKNMPNPLCLSSSDYAYQCLFSFHSITAVNNTATITYQLLNKTDRVSHRWVKVSVEHVAATYGSERDQSKPLETQQYDVEQTDILICTISAVYIHK